MLFKWYKKCNIFMVFYFPLLAIPCTETFVLIEGGDSKLCCFASPSLVLILTISKVLLTYLGLFWTKWRFLSEKMKILLSKYSKTKAWPHFLIRNLNFWKNSDITSCYFQVWTRLHKGFVQVQTSDLNYVLWAQWGKIFDFSWFSPDIYLST